MCLEPRTSRYFTPLSSNPELIFVWLKDAAFYLADREKKARLEPIGAVINTFLIVLRNTSCHLSIFDAPLPRPAVIKS